MSKLDKASLLEDITSVPNSRSALFVYSHASMESLADQLNDRYSVRLRGPHHMSFETMQQTEADDKADNAKESTFAHQHLQELRMAGVLDPADAQQSQGSRVFVLSNPKNDEERRALAAISTSLVTSAMNDPHRTVAAFLPLTDGEHYPEEQTNALRGLLGNLGVATFESLESLQQHLLH